MNLKIQREKTNNRTTLGKLYIDGVFFCHTLEDVVRGFGEKIDGETAIPAGQYNIKLTMSSRFKRIMPLVYNTPSLTVESNGVKFAGVRLHGGNTHEHTHGCPLVAFNRISDTKIQGSAESSLTSKIQSAIVKGESIKLVIENA